MNKLSIEGKYVILLMKNLHQHNKIANTLDLELGSKYNDLWENFMDLVIDNQQLYINMSKKNNDDKFGLNYDKISSKIYSIIWNNEFEKRSDETLLLNFQSFKRLSKKFFKEELSEYKQELEKIKVISLSKDSVVNFQYDIENEKHLCSAKFDQKTKELTNIHIKNDLTISEEDLSPSQQYILIKEINNLLEK